MVMANTKAPLRILRLHEVKARTGLSRSTIYQLISNNQFPKQVSLGAQSVGWVEMEIEAWIVGRIKARKLQ